MKTFSHFFILSAAVWILASCSNTPQGEKATTSDARDVQQMAADAMEYTVNHDSSLIEWTGAKPTGQHNGMVRIKSGTLYTDKGSVVGGKFIMDMNSITVLDLTDEDMNSKLTNHLKSGDFFNVESHPEAVFEITKVEKFEGQEEPKKEPEGSEAPTHLITGNLTIKGISKNITFGAVITTDNGTIRATSPQFLIDRTEWDIRFKSKKFFDDLKDQFINDEFGIAITLQATPAG